MSCRYLILCATCPQQTDSDYRAIADRLSTLGMQLRLSSEAWKLFVSQDTPTRQVSKSAVVIGDLFLNRGAQSLQEIYPEDSSTQTQLRKWIIDNCWGDYVLLQSGYGGPEQLSVMRDPSGALPCMYCIQSGAGFITSDIGLASKAGLYTRKTDWNYITSFLNYRLPRGGRTGLVSIHELAPGSALVVHRMRAETLEEWSPWRFVEHDQRHTDIHEAASAIRTATSSVVEALANQDRSLLLELSGGLDSSIVGLCLKDSRAKVTCCNLRTPMPGADERHYATLVSEAIRAELRSVELPLDEEPVMFCPPAYLAIPAVTPLQHAIDATIASVGRSRGVASYFTGAGGDTVFGFQKTAAPAADAILEHGFGAGITSIHNMSELHQCTFWKAGYLTLRKMYNPPKSARKLDRSFLAPSCAVPSPPEHPWFSTPENALPGDRERIIDLTTTHSYRDGAPRGMQQPLRMPLLSQPVIEACLRVPSWMWMDGGVNRAVARLAFSDVLPAEVLSRRSKGTFMSYSGAIYQRSRSQMKAVLLGGNLHAKGLLDGQAIKHALERPARSRDTSFMRLFHLCMIESWVRQQS